MVPTSFYSLCLLDEKTEVQHPKITMSWGMGKPVPLGFDLDGNEAKDLDSIRGAVTLDLGALPIPAGLAGRG